jgi:hypothetical protein
MDIESIRKIIFPAVKDVIVKLEENSHEVKLVILRDIFNEAINGSLNISHTNNSSIKAMFSGRGRVWARTEVSDSNIVWSKIKIALESELFESDISSKSFEEHTNMIDMFENEGFAWMRFGSISKQKVVFHLRTKGSKLDYHIKVYIDSADVLNGKISNLDGVPHKIGLEPGIFEDLKLKKELIDIPVSKEDLRNLGIQTIEDLI